MSAIVERTGIHASKATIGSDDAGAGQALLAALAKFITPLIHGYTTVGDKSYTPGGPIAEDLTRPANDTLRSESGVTADGQILLDALKSFAASLENSPNGPDMARQFPKNSDQDDQDAADEGTDIDTWESSGLGLFEFWLDEGWNMDMWKSSGLDLIVPEPGPNLQEFIEKRINFARSTVFNEMPIRLLKFDQHGKGITLVERSQVMECISAEIISNSETAARDFSGFYYIQTVFERYAILSHTWLSEGEITYSDWAEPTVLIDPTSPGYRKLAKFCETAANEGLRLAWMDTVCINKESSSELDESIRSMFKWYQKADVCIVYLAETGSREDLKSDRWFTRGWTLQELLAPERIMFYSKHWRILGCKCYNTHLHGSYLSNDIISLEICAATGLEEDELSCSPHYIGSVPIWRKMQWAANRKVTREEDAAYSLMGIFNVSMPTGYGEGAEHAFMRLVREILNSKLNSTSKLEIANWGADANSLQSSLSKFRSSISSSNLIPTGPDAYQHTLPSNIQFYPAPSLITLSYMGLCVPVLLMPSRVDKDGPNNSFTPVGDYSGIIHCQSTWSSNNNVYKILDGTLFHNNISDLNTVLPISTGEFPLTMAVLNIGDEVDDVLLPENSLCLAVQLQYKALISWEIPEDITWKSISSPCTFDLVHHNNSSIRIPKAELIRHGMTLRMMYL